MGYLLVIYLAVSYFLGWYPFDNTEKSVESSSFNVYFYYPNDKEEYLGQVNGLSSCQSSVSSFAYEKNISRENWSYICCRITSDSSCASKHK